MSLLLIPTFPSTPHQSMRVTLDGVTYEIHHRWNHRASLWLLDLYDAARNPLALGRPVVVDAYLIRQFHHIAGVPPGELVAFDTTEREIDPRFDDYGTRVELYYFDKAELLSLGTLADAVSLGS